MGKKNHSLTPAAVGQLGFGRGGISSGSTAANIMSTGRGYTPAAVSAMQSIGATGTSWAPGPRPGFGGANYGGGNGFKK